MILLPDDNENHMLMHGCRKDFSQGVSQERIFPKFFARGPKVVKFGFHPSKLKKQPFFANNFKSRGGQGPSLPPFRRPCVYVD